MKLPQKLQQFGVRLQKLPKRYYLFSVLGLGVLFYGIVFFIPKPVVFSYGGDTCTSQLTLLPQLHSEADSSKFSVKYEDTMKIAGVELASSKVCFSPMAAPTTGETVVATAPAGGLVARKHFLIQASSYPVANLAPIEKPIPATKLLKLPLDKSDKIFEYDLSVSNKETACRSEGRQLVCDIPALKLKQGSTYDFSLSRQFNGGSETELQSGDLHTLKPLKIKKTSIKNKQTIYSRSKTFTIVADKPLESARVSLSRDVKNKKPEQIAIKTELKGDKLTITAEKDLARDSLFKLTISILDAIDGSTLTEPRSLQFRMSGGPKLTGANVGVSRAPLSGDIILSFDQVLSPSQDITKFITASGARASIIRGSSSVILRYMNAPKCRDIRVTVKAGIKSKYNVVQKQPTSFNTRTICHTLQTIGYSREGRPINAYFFGNGGKTVLFTGAIHGNEKSSNYIMESWIADLETKARQIPADKQVVVVPMLNPDGFYVHGRENAKGVNLNRNFPTSNWEKDITVSGGGTDKGGGGASGGSEPETKALMALTNQLSPYFTITYHSSGAIVNSNDIGRASTLGPQYARGVGYGYVPNGATESTFGFNLTGTYEDWMLETGRPAILIELSGDSGNYFYNHGTTMWTMVKS